MFSKVLIANRGEIAVRIMRTCKELGIKTVAVYSEVDSKSSHVQMANESVCIGKDRVSETYLNSQRIIEAAKDTGATAIHPGYGYLAEEGKFAEECEKNGLVFIGPKPQILHLAGDKLTAKSIAQRAGVPTILGANESISSIENAISVSEDMGYPVIIKASGGGGGRGMRICNKQEELLSEFPIAKAEAQAAFGNDKLYIEKYVVSPRHIEFQILCDKFGNAVHLGERECTIQRRYQKLIEESPSPVVDDELRRKMGDAAILVAKSVDYLNAGTIEFLVDNERNFYFMEINARIQVEHPVTEIVSGCDIVKEQLKIATGEKIALNYNLDQRISAIECRINAEDPESNFLPCPGTVEIYRPPGGYGVRLDTHIYQGYEVPPFYDSLIAKLVAYGPDRVSAIETMKRALSEFTISPVKTTIPLYQRVMSDPDFVKGEFDTDFIKRFLPEEETED